MQYKEYQKLKNLRPIEGNEIVFDVDNPELGFEAINFIGVNLYKEGYNFEIYYAESIQPLFLFYFSFCFICGL